MRSFAPFLAAVFALVSVATPSRAAETAAPAPDRPLARPFGIEVGGSVGGAAATDSGSYHAYGVGLRARVGVALRDVYLGGVVGAYNLSGRESPGTMLVGVQVGYGFRFFDDQMVLRPTIGTGILGVMSAGADNGVYYGPPWANNARTPVFVEPGVTVLCTPGGPFLLGASAALFLPAVDQLGQPGGFPAGVSFGAELGFRIP